MVPVPAAQPDCISASPTLPPAPVQITGDGNCFFRALGDQLEVRLREPRGSNLLT